jgi:hypothetical protein
MSVTRTQVFTGAERRSGFERRTEAPRESVTAPRIVGSIDVPGFGVFGPGQEKQLNDAVQKYNSDVQEHNKTAKTERDRRAEIDLDAHERAGRLRNFGKAAQSPLSRNEQRDFGGTEAVEVANPGFASIPGGAHIDELHPRPPEVSQGSVPTAPQHERTASGRGGARRGGAGRSGARARSARGERSQADGE